MNKCPSGIRLTLSKIQGHIDRCTYWKFSMLSTIAKRLARHKLFA